MCYDRQLNVLRLQGLVLGVFRLVLSGIWSPASSYTLNMITGNYVASHTAHPKWQVRNVLNIAPYIAITKIYRRFQNIPKKKDPCQQAWFCKSPFTSSLPRSADCERIRGGAQNKSKYPKAHFAGGYYLCDIFELRQMKWSTTSVNEKWPHHWKDILM